MSEPTRTRQLSDSGNTHASVLRRFSTLKTFPAARHPHLQNQVLAAASFVKRLEEQSPLSGHLGCVNTIAWDETGEYLVSGSDDRYLNIYRPMDTEPLVHRIRSGHRQNIFSAKFMTGSSASKIVSCSAEGTTILTDVNRFIEKSRLDDWMPNPSFNCHDDTTYEVLPDLVDGHIFFDWQVYSDDGKINRYDTRIRTSCSCDDSNEPCDRHVLININSHLKMPSYHGLSVQDRILLSFSNRRRAFGVSAITQRPELPFYIAAACGDDTVRIYDSRMIDPKDDRKAQVYSFSPFIPHGETHNGDMMRNSVPERRHLETRITSLKYDPNGSGQLLASFSRGDCYLINPTELITRQEELQRPLGQRKISSGDSTSHNDNADGDTDSSFQVQSDPKGKRRRASSDSQEEPGKKTEKIALKDLPSVKAKLGQPALKKTVSTESDQSTQERHKAMRVRFDTTESTRSMSEDTKKDTKESGDSSYKPESGKESVSELEFNTSDSMPELEPAESEDRSMEANDWETTEDDSEDDEIFFRNILENDDTSDDDDEDDDDDLSLSEIFSNRRLNDVYGSSASEDESRDDSKEYWQRRSLRTAKQDMVQAYSGHRNARTMIKEANFFGPNSEFIMSGSDGGQIFFWDKVTGKIVNIVKGDKNVVNCVQGHPVSSFMLAASGIDKTTKIFMPTAQEPVKVSSLRGIKPPSTNTHVVRPRSSPEPAARPADPDDELDPEHAYDAIVQVESSDDVDDDFFNDDDDDEDEDEDGDGDDDDDDHFSRNRAPPHLILQLLRHLANHRRAPASENTAPGSSASGPSRTADSGSRAGHDGNDGDEDDDGLEEESDDQTMSST